MYVTGPFNTFLCLSVSSVSNNKESNTINALFCILLVKSLLSSSSFSCITIIKFLCGFSSFSSECAVMFCLFSWNVSVPTNFRLCENCTMENSLTYDNCVSQLTNGLDAFYLPLISSFLLGNRITLLTVNSIFQLLYFWWFCHFNLKTFRKLFWCTIDIQLTASYARSSLLFVSINTKPSNFNP